MRAKAEMKIEACNYTQSAREREVVESVSVEGLTFQVHKAIWALRKSFPLLSITATNE